MSRCVTLIVGEELEAVVAGHAVEESGDCEAAGDRLSQDGVILQAVSPSVWVTNVVHIHS